MTDTLPWWAREDLWRKVAIWVTTVSFVILIILTFDSLAKIEPGKGRVPPYSVINQRITYEFDEAFNWQRPVIGGEAPLSDQPLSEAQAAALVNHGKKVIQAKNCMNCHTLLGNGAYYAPDLTKAWLDPAWGTESSRELLMFQFLKNPELFARTFGSGRKMPNLDLTDDEARAVMAYLKWMSAIDTNGFPFNFKTFQ